MREKLIEVSCHVQYEMWMLRAMRDVLSSQMAISATSPDLARAARNAQAVRNALIESFAIHARNLIVFFYPRRPHRDGVTTADFFPKPDPWKPPKETPLLIHACEKANKQAAHITWSRAKYVGKLKEWDHQRITDDIEVVWKAFLCGVPRENLDPARFAPDLAAVAIADEV